MLNPYLKGAKARTLREHSAGVRVGRTAWGAAGAPAQARALAAQPPATPRGAGTARSALTLRGAALAGNYAGASPLEQAEPAEGASVGVSVRELDEGAGQGEDAEQGRQLGAPLAAAALAAAASPPPYSPPAAMVTRTPLGPAPGGATKRLAAVASDTKQGVQPLRAGGGSGGGGGGGGGGGTLASVGNPLREALGGSYGSAAGASLASSQTLPPSRLQAPASRSLASPPPPSLTGPLAQSGGMAWSTANPLLRR